MKINSQEFISIEKELDLQFCKFCTLELINNIDGTLHYRPQENYDNSHNLPFLNNIDMNTNFCRFKPNLPNQKGLYIWVVNDEIIYIGEAVNLRSRFNRGYGHISPRNCFKGGRSTNVRMNRVALTFYENGSTTDIYIYATEDHKQKELDLLNRINTPYNIMNN